MRKPERVSKMAKFCVVTPVRIFGRRERKGWRMEDKRKKLWHCQLGV